MNELKLCPFCGNKVEVEKIPLWYGNGRGYSGCYDFRIKCENCGGTVDQPKNDSIYRSEEEARDILKKVSFDFQTSLSVRKQYGDYTYYVVNITP